MLTDWEVYEFQSQWDTSYAYKMAALEIANNYTILCVPQRHRVAAVRCPPMRLSLTHKGQRFMPANDCDVAIGAAVGHATAFISRAAILFLKEQEFFGRRSHCRY